DGRVRALTLDEAEHRAGLSLDDREGVRSRTAQAELSGRVVAPGPYVAGSGVLQVGDQRGPLERFVAERRPVVIVQRRLERGRADVPIEDARVRVVEDRGFDPAVEQHLRLAHEVLVESVLAGD